MHLIVSHLPRQNSIVQALHGGSRVIEVNTHGTAEHSPATMQVSVAGSEGRTVVAGLPPAALGCVSHTYA